MKTKEPEETETTRRHRATKKYAVKAFVGLSN
jgi:hypothetical protein